MTRAVFENIGYTIMTELEQCNHEINIAVAWFTNPSIYRVLVKKLEEHKKVSLLISDHENNSGKLPFKTFVKLNGSLWIYKTVDGRFMHNKYAIIDNAKVITGSYNYSVGAQKNQENVIIDTNPSIVADYKKHFETLTNSANKIHGDSDILFPKSGTELNFEDKKQYALAQKFNNEMFKNIEYSKIIGLKVNFGNLIAFIDRFTPVGAAKYLSTAENGDKIQTGLQQLYEKNRLDLSFEYLVIKDEYSGLFDTLTIASAKKKLQRLGII